MTLEELAQSSAAKYQKEENERSLWMKLPGLRDTFRKWALDIDYVNAYIIARVNAVFYGKKK